MNAQKLSAVLAPSSIAAGITFEDGTTNSQTLTTISDGTAAVNVVAGNLFTSVLVTATLSTDATKSATSYGVAVTSGNAAQDTISVSAQNLSMEAWNRDGVTNSINVIVSDRLGNPLPKGTLVNFVSNNGVLTGADGSRGTCALSELSRCSVTYSSSNGTSRPANGRISILAYMAGEESFIDSNGNNVWDAREVFYPVGRPFLDANENGIYDAGEQRIGTSVAGTAACAPSGYPSEVNTCDDTAWSADVLVRQQIIIVQATSDAVITKKTWTNDAFDVIISDKNKTTSNNSMPTGSTIAAVVTPAIFVDKDGNPVSGSCALAGLSSEKIMPSTKATDITVYLNGASDCVYASITVTVTSPGGTKTAVPFFPN